MRTIPIEPPISRSLVDGKIPSPPRKRKCNTCSDMYHTLRPIPEELKKHFDEIKIAKGDLHDIEFPDGIRLSDLPEYYEDNLHLFKYIIDLTFKREWISKFIDGLNIELLDADNYKWSIRKSGCNFYEMNGKYNLDITIKQGMWVSKIIYRYRSREVMFYIPNDEYRRLYNICKVKAESKKMNTLFKTDIDIDNYKEFIYD
jgi:hypothetical protein